MRTLKPLSRIGLAFAALICIAAVAAPAAAQERFEDRYPYRGNIYNYDYQNYRHYQRHHRRHENDGFFSFGFGGPAYSEPYYYAPPPRYYPPPAYYQPGPSFNLTVPLGD